MSVEVTLLGTGGPIPHPERAGPATLLRAGDATILVDCGRGVVMRLTAAGTMPIGLSAVLLTHLHSDHITDLNDLVTTQWIMTFAPTPLRVFGPPGTRQVVDAVFEMLAHDRRYRHDHHADLQHPPLVEVTEVVPGDAFDVGPAHVVVHETDHRPVAPTVGYRVEHGGAAVAIGGDGVPCPGLDGLCAGADVYVQTVIRDDLVLAVPNQRFRDVCDYHSTVEQAASTAARAGVRTLVLTHLVPAPGSAEEVEEWRRRAAAAFGGEVVVGDDLTVVQARPPA